MPENEAKRCFMRSLSYWSHKTLESNMSVLKLSGACELYLASTYEIFCLIPFHPQAEEGTEEYFPYRLLPAHAGAGVSYSH